MTRSASGIFEYSQSLASCKVCDPKNAPKFRQEMRYLYRMVLGMPTDCLQGFDISSHLCQTGSDLVDNDVAVDFLNSQDCLGSWAPPCATC